MKRLLPLGTIVKLKEETDKIMIVSRLVRKERNGEIFDYCGCLVPQGIQNPNNVVIFNHEDVNRLLFIGFQDEQEIEYSYTISNLDRKEL